MKLGYKNATETKSAMQSAEKKLYREVMTIIMN